MKNCPMYSLRSSVLPSLRSGPGAVFSKWPLRIDSSKSDYDFAALRSFMLAALAALGLGANIVWSLCSVNLAFRRKGAL